MNEESQEAVVELYLRPVRFWPCPHSLFKFNEPCTALVSRKDSVEELVKKFQRAFNNRLYELREKSVMVNKMRLWKSLSVNFEEIQTLT